jgi:hypothetical protein
VPAATQALRQHRQTAGHEILLLQFARILALDHYYYHHKYSAIFGAGRLAGEQVASA